MAFHQAYGTYFILSAMMIEVTAFAAQYLADLRSSLTLLRAMQLFGFDGRSVTAVGWPLAVHSVFYRS